MQILLAEGFNASLPDKLRELGTLTEDMANLGTSQVLLVRSKTKCTREFLEEAPALKLIIRGGVGLDNVDLPAAKERGIVVRNTPRASSIAVAELAFGLMLAAPSRLVEGHLSLTQGKWAKKELKRTELYGKTLGLVGMGNIATELALRARAFGMTTLGYDAFKDSSEAAEMVGSLKELLQRSDYVSLHLPLTDATKRMINKETLEMMKEGATLINTSREGVICAEGVRLALESGRLSWYCTDVWPKDPPPEDYPLLRAPRVIMTPHLGAQTKENMERISQEICTIIQEYLKEGLL